jgi:hypothetical protein
MIFFVIPLTKFISWAGEVAHFGAGYTFDSLLNDFNHIIVLNCYVNVLKCLSFSGFFS